ncbi:DMT family transporter [Klebsiella aerogenes]|uniref:DMT family transporter n=1 Tax=Klebsiella aerogenes TaxID=548 RepID=UPI003870FD0B
MNMLMIILSLIGGALLSVQAAVNGRLGAQVGILRSAFLTFSIGALVTGLFIVFFAPQQSMTLLDVPKWQLLGAFCGVPYIVIMVLAVQRIGTATATVAVIFGQLAMSLLIDNFGWLGNSAIAFSPIAFSPQRLAAVLCLALALYFIYASGVSGAVAPSKRPGKAKWLSTERE